MEPQITPFSPLAESTLTSNIHSPQSPKYLQKLQWILAGIVLLGVGIVAGIFLGKQLYSPATQPSPTPSPLPSEVSTQGGDPTVNWKTYTDSALGFEFKYPSEYKPVDSVVNGQIDKSRVNFEADTTSYLSLIKKNLIPYDEKNFCSPNTKIYPCIYTEGWKQNTPVSEIILGGKKAASFYMTVTSGPSSPYHIILTREVPYIELRMFVAGGGLDQTFKQILSTFKFLDQNQTYACPQTAWVNCMPGPNAPQNPQCSTDYYSWAKRNCPNFQGLAY